VLLEPGGVLGRGGSKILGPRFLITLSCWLGVVQAALLSFANWLHTAKGIWEDIASTPWWVVGATLLAGASWEIWRRRTEPDSQRGG
jgi:hypothetical protein